MMVLIAVVIFALITAFVLVSYIERLIERFCSHSKENKKLMDNIKKMENNDSI